LLFSYLTTIENSTVPYYRGEEIAKMVDYLNCIEVNPFELDDGENDYKGYDEEHAP